MRISETESTRSKTSVRALISVVITTVLYLLPAAPLRAGETAGKPWMDYTSGADALKNAPGNCILPTVQKKESDRPCFSQKLVDCEKQRDGQPSAGECLKQVRTCFEEAAGTGSGQTWCANASDSGQCLISAGYKAAWTAESKDDRSAGNVLHPINQGGTWSIDLKTNPKTNEPIPDPLPTGTVVVYGGTNGAGHIEIMTGNNRVCSDYCSATLRSEQAPSERWIIGIYLPPTDGASCRTQQ